MSKRLICVVVAALLLLTVGLSVASAASPAQQGTTYTVKLGDYLCAIAEKYLGDCNAWPSIMAFTNRKNVEDSTYAKIVNADLIQPGYKLLVPSTADAEAFLATYDPGQPGQLFGAGPQGQLVVGSWWTAGGEAQGLLGMFDIYKAKYPGVEIVNGAVAGGAGSVFKGVLKTRLIGGKPPDVFQLHAGLEVQGYSPEQYLTPLDDLYVSEGWETAFPADLVTLLKSYQGHYWGVPVNIHRSNVVWYNKAIFEANGLTPPTSFDEFFAVADALKAKGITPYVLANNGGWEAPHAFESVLAGTCGAEKYKGLWTGAVAWTDSCVTQALETFKRMVSYANTDYSALTWDAAAGYIVDGKGAMFIMGDWANGYFTAKNFTGYGWATPPGTKGIYIVLSDSFALPAAAPDKDNAMAWLKVCGSKEGQEAFNPKKGSICARTDCDPALFNDYLKSAMTDWARDAIVPSVVHGAAAYESWATDYKNIISLFVTSGDVAATQTSLQAACVDAEICQ